MDNYMGRLDGKVAIVTGAEGGMGFADAQETFSENIPLPPHIGEPDDIANGVLFLASDESTFVTGQELTIDGGFSAR